MRLDAVKAVITGAGGGLGRTFTRELIKAGGKVMATDIDEHGLEETARLAGGALTHASDVTKEQDVETLFKLAREKMGGCNVLVNNAGVLRDKSLVKADKETGKGVKNMTKQDWDIVMNVNLTGPFLCAREFAAQAIGTEESAAIVNISSSSRAGYPSQSNYSAAKAGLVADTAVWSKELAKYGIRVGAVAPGVVATAILDSVPPELKERLVQQVPLKRLADPLEVWLGVRFILECDYFTGRVLEIDGGLVR